MVTNASFYAGQPPLNRLSFQRNDADKLNAYLPDAKFMLFQYAAAPQTSFSDLN